MVADWLYPLSSQADYFFTLVSGRTRDTSPASFEQMIQLGGNDDVWGAHKNWRRMKADDRMWVYYGTADGDLGIVGLATVESVKPPGKHGHRADVLLRWDKPATHRLLSNPFPAQKVRKYVPWPAGAAYAVPAPLGKLLMRHATHPAAPQLPVNGKYGSAVPSSVSYTPPTSVTVRLRHDALLRPFERRLISAGWKPEPFNIGAKRADLVMRRGSKLLLVEAKTIGSSTNEAVRAAFAQLAEYAWLYQKGHPKGPVAAQWALFESRPTEDEVRFLEDHGVQVTWASRSSRRLVHSAGTAAKASVAGI